MPSLLYSILVPLAFTVVVTLVWSTCCVFATIRREERERERAVRG
jgi:hypothetical protein